MTRKLLFLFVLFITVSGFAQDDARVPLRGSVIYMNIGVPNENVINSTSEHATITNDQGQFKINVKVGDQLVFTAVNYNIKVVTITEEILANNRLVVEVNEKVTELDEVVITPEQQERFLKMRNEEFKQHEYEIDRGTEVENIAMSDVDRGMQDGLNFVNIFRAIFKSQDQAEEEKPRLKVSEVLRQVYDDSFFVVDLQIPQDKINEFLYYCDARMPAKSLLKKENEFQLIDALVNHSKSFLKDLNEE
ncbi:carboxypeptidase-like regulatory domain-containing protein [Maribacter dokdonensis]|uniref:carboxypeptidase-like regulatory domain-containing protein n=1 Tax=Maribacter dokdonensis TaxID=320912 RepID=UPI001C093446|nr:carboxypeptidase-like regulatory domain-containing protein [Maribacter dokdonensis]MBU2899495.1 carboxypeptidase-like regulatory domain-containing protein [Maribacter dokdonensis]